MRRSRGHQDRLALREPVGDIGDETLREPLLGVPEGNGVTGVRDVRADLGRGNGEGGERRREAGALGVVVLDGAAHGVAELAHDQQAESAATEAVGLCAVDVRLEERGDQLVRDAGPSSLTVRSTDPPLRAALTRTFGPP